MATLGHVINEGQELRFDVGGVDPDDDDIVISADALPRGAVFDPTSLEFAWKPTDQQGDQSFVAEFRVSDGALFDAAAVSIDVVSVDRRARFLSTSDELSGTFGTGSDINFTLRAVDPDGDPLTFGDGGLPEGAVRRGSDVSWIPVSDQVGTHVLTFFVKGDQSAAGPANRLAAEQEEFDDELTATLTIVSNNRTPRIDPIANDFAAVGDEKQITISAFDPNPNAILTLEVGQFRSATAPQIGPVTSGEEAGGTRASAVLSWTPTDADADKAVAFGVRATDEGGLRDTTAFVLGVGAVNTPPSLELAAEVFIVRESIREIFNVNRETGEQQGRQQDDGSDDAI